MLGYKTETHIILMEGIREPQMKSSRRAVDQIALVGALAASCVLADVVHVRDYQTHEPAERNVRFALAVTPEQDVLSFVIRRSGNWRLTRIQGWLDKAPSEQTISIPGWPPEPLGHLENDLFVTADGGYAICVAGVVGPRGGHSDKLISVVDLRRFAVTKTVHASDFGAELWNVYQSATSLGL